jgi:hypothetical protein
MIVIVCGACCFGWGLHRSSKRANPLASDLHLGVPSYQTNSYGDVAPGTVENFAMIALGQTPDGISYKGSKLHRVIENFMVQGGDIINGDGTGSFTVWDGKGGKFADENLLAVKHSKGTLSMANSGPNTNGTNLADPDLTAV